MLATIALVALRLGIGWQFFQEGADKLQNGFNSSYFLGAAKGPFADVYKSSNWDTDGRIRLNYIETEGEVLKPGSNVDVNLTLAEWDEFRVKAGKHYGWDEKQEKRAKDLMNRHKVRLENYFDVNPSVGYGLDIYEYFKQLERVEANSATEERYAVASLAGQRKTIEGDLAKQRNKLLKPVDELWKVAEDDMNSNATLEQRQLYGPIKMTRWGEPALGSKFADSFIPYFDLVIGILLVLGLFTRPTSLVAAFFLLTVVVSQWPWAYDVQPTAYQFNLMLALLVLAATRAGRFFGLDFFVSAAWVKIFGGKKRGISPELTGEAA